MSKDFLRFLASLGGGNPSQQMREALREAAFNPDSPLNPAHFRLLPCESAFDDRPKAEAAPASPRSAGGAANVPEGFDLLVASLRALEEQAPLQAAALELGTLVRMLAGLVEGQHLSQLSQEEYTAILSVLKRLDNICESCESCPRSPQYPTSDAPSQ